MSIQTVEIRQFAGPATVELSNVGIPEIVEVRQGPAGPNSVTSATTTDFTTGQVLYANGANVGSLSRSGIDSRTSFPNDDVTASTASPDPDTIVKRNGAGDIVAASSFLTNEGGGFSAGGITGFTNHQVTLNYPATTASRSWTFQDADGTVAHLSDITVTPTNTVTLTNKTLTNPTVTNFTETVVSGGNTGTSQTIALTNGTVQTFTLTGNCTFTMPTATAGKSFTVLLNTGTGGFTATFTGVKWAGNTAPTITATASRRDIVSFIADGSAWYGSIIQNYTP